MLVFSAFYHSQVALAAPNSQYYCFLPGCYSFPIRKTFPIIHELYSTVEWLCKHAPRGFASRSRCACSILLQGNAPGKRWGHWDWWDWANAQGIDVKAVTLS